MDGSRIDEAPMQVVDELLAVGGLGVSLRVDAWFVEWVMTLTVAGLRVGKQVGRQVLLFQS